MLVLLALGAAALVLILVVLRGGEAGDGDLLPPELKGARLVISEKTIERKRPVAVRGRPDEVWVKDGRRVIIETKSRAGGVYPADRMQLAAYAYILRGDGGMPLSAYGYIRFTGGAEGPRFQKVKLKPDDDVIAAHRKLQRILRGKDTPEFARQAALCGGCGHIDRCPSPKTPKAA
ncbi:MAG: Dna2/Cas4 domain-containing protein [Pseudomonadota bacterium]